MLQSLVRALPRAVPRSHLIVASCSSPLVEQRRYKVTATPRHYNSKKTATPPSFASRHHQHSQRDHVVSQLQQLTKRGSASMDMELLRHAATLLQNVQTPEQLRAALPLCKLVQRAETLHGAASAECVRIYEALGKHREALDVSELLLKNDFFLTNPVLTSAIQASAVMRDTDRGFELFERGMKRGTIPNRNVFVALLALSASAGDAISSPRVQDLLQQMKKSDVELNHTMFHHWMATYAKAGHYERVEELFERIDEFGVKPSAPTYGILMDTYAEQGDYDKTIAVLNELKNEPGIEVSLVHYNVALKACGKASQLTQAFNLYEEMKTKKIAPDLVTYITMMHAVYHGELGVIDTKKVKIAMGGVGALALTSVPFIDFQEYLMTVLFCGSLVGSMGLAVYMNPNGAMRALYPNTDEPSNDTVIEAFFRRLREEDHCGRSMYLWREMLKHGIAPDPRVYDVLVRTCVKKRHPELAYEAVIEEQNVPLVDTETGAFMLSLPTVVSFLQSLYSQRRMPMVDAVFDTARSHRAFKDIFSETTDVYSYDLRAFGTASMRSYVVRRILSQLHGESKLFGSSALPRIEFVVLHGFDLLDQIDMDDAQMRSLFSMDEMTREKVRNASGNNNNNNNQHYFRLSIPRDRLAAFFASPLASATQQKL